MEGVERREWSIRGIIRLIAVMVVDTVEEVGSRRLSWI